MVAPFLSLWLNREVEWKYQVRHWHGARRDVFGDWMKMSWRADHRHPPVDRSRLMWRWPRQWSVRPPRWVVLQPEQAQKKGWMHASKPRTETRLLPTAGRGSLANVRTDLAKIESEEMLSHGPQ